MRKIRDVLRLTHALGMSRRLVGEATGIGKTAVGGSYRNNPLVVEQGMSTKQAECLDKFGKGGGLVDGKLVREFPVCRNSAN